MPPTMEDVAKRAGVSKSTVSLALNNKPGISLELQENILQAAKDLGYHLPERRPFKRPLENKTITVVHCAGLEPASESELSQFYLEYFTGIQTFLREKNTNLTLIASYREGDDGHLGFHLLKNKQVTPPDGLILMGVGVNQDSQIIRRVLEEKITTVVLGRNWSHLPLSSVSQDHYQQAWLAFDYLMKLGHQKIAFVAKESDQHYDWFAWRLSCYKEAMAQVNDQLDEDLIVLGTTGSEAAKILVARRPDVTAIFAINDGLAVDVMAGLRESGLKVPQDISVVGVDDSRRPPVDFPALTTVAFPRYEVGYLGAELLLKQIENDQIYYSNLVVRSNLIPRGSCTEPRAP